MPNLNGKIKLPSVKIVYILRSLTIKCVALKGKFSLVSHRKIPIFILRNTYIRYTYNNYLKP